MSGQAPGSGALGVCTRCSAHALLEGSGSGWAPRKRPALGAMAGGEVCRDPKDTDEDPQGAPRNEGESGGRQSPQAWQFSFAAGSRVAKVAVESKKATWAQGGPWVVLRGPGGRQGLSETER